jgi:hypothetical protein
MVAALLLCGGGTAGSAGGRRVLGKAGGVLWHGNRRGQHGQGRRHPVVHELGQGRPAVRAQQGHSIGQKAGGRGGSVQEEKGAMAAVLLVVRTAQGQRCPGQVRRGVVAR